MPRPSAPIDVSMPLFPGMPAFPGDPAFTSARAHSIDRGDPYNVSQISLGTHAGTHVDPPVHFVPGARTIDQVDPRILNGPCWVVRVPDRHSEIGAAEIEAVPRGAKRVLFRTSNSARWERRLEFFPEYVALSPEASRAAVRRGWSLVGIDSLSVESDSTGLFPVHHELLGHGLAIVEGLRLARAPPGRYRMSCLPLLLRGGDGGPARVLLWPAGGP